MAGRFTGQLQQWQPTLVGIAQEPQRLNERSSCDLPPAVGEVRQNIPVTREAPVVTSQPGYAGVPAWMAPNTSSPHEAHNGRRAHVTNRAPEPRCMQTAGQNSDLEGQHYNYGGGREQLPGAWQNDN